MTTRSAAIALLIYFTSPGAGAQDLRPLTEPAIIVQPNRLIGGASATGIVMLPKAAPAGGLKVSLTSGQSFVIVPSVVVIPGSAREVRFSITTRPIVPTATSEVDGVPAKIAARIGLGSFGTTLTVLAPSPSSIVVSNSTVEGGMTTSGFVTLSGPAPDGGLVLLFSDDEAPQQPRAVWIASSPIPSGETRGTFTVKTGPVPQSKSVTISARVAVTSARTTMQVLLGVTSLVLDPGVGAVRTGHLTLSGPAPAAGLPIKIRPIRIEPPIQGPCMPAVPDLDVFVPAGWTTATFGWNLLSSLAASYILNTEHSGVSRRWTTPRLEIDAPQVALELPASMKPGEVATGKITLTMPALDAPCALGTFFLESQWLNLEVDPSATIAPGLMDTTFTIRARSAEPKTGHVHVFLNKTHLKSASVTLAP